MFCRLGLVLAVVSVSAIGCGGGGPRVDGCDPDPNYQTLVGVSGDLGQLGQRCQLHKYEVGLALRLSVPDGTTLTLWGQPWTPDADGIHWLDLRPLVADLPVSALEKAAQRFEGPVTIPVGITADGATRQASIQLELGALDLRHALRSVKRGYRLPAAADGAKPTALAYVGARARPTTVLGEAERIRDLGYVATARHGDDASHQCGPYSSLSNGGAHHIKQVAEVIDVTVFDAHTGEQVTTRTFTAAPDCPPAFTSGKMPRAEIDEADVLTWLKAVQGGGA